LKFVNDAAPKQMPVLIQRRPSNAMRRKDCFGGQLAASVGIEDPFSQKWIGQSARIPRQQGAFAPGNICKTAIGEEPAVYGSSPDIRSTAGLQEFMKCRAEIFGAACLQGQHSVIAIPRARKGPGVTPRHIAETQSRDSHVLSIWDMGHHGRGHPMIMASSTRGVFHHRGLDAAQHAVCSDERLPPVRFSPACMHHPGIGVNPRDPIALDGVSSGSNRFVQPELIVPPPVDEIKRIALVFGKQEPAAIAQGVLPGTVKEGPLAPEGLGGNTEDFLKYTEGLPGDESAADFLSGKPGFIENEDLQSLPGQHVPGRRAGGTCPDDQCIDCVGTRQSAHKNVQVKGARYGLGSNGLIPIPRNRGI